ncbi:glycosyltransferase family 4 protein [Kaistia sp. MMO-174]|uniref:glycosyltransferase family 4 protein n=1 Tax=Kaistia sp. MMO-174 TaxID=3081256 RepID=UPI003017798E
MAEPLPRETDGSARSEGSPRRRILHILPDGSAGGGGTAVLGLCRDLLATGRWDVALVTAPGSAVMEQAKAAGIRTHGLDFFTSRLDPRIARRLARPVEATRPDIVHAHGARAALPFCFPALRHIGPLVYTVHGFHHVRKPFPLRQLSRLAERRIAARAAAVVFVSAGDQSRAANEEILPRRDPKATVIANGIDPADFDGLTATEERFDLVFAGRAHQQKNPFFMIEIMEALRTTGIRLRMICGGELEAAVRARVAVSPARDQIVLSGALPRRDVLRAFLSARLYVQPSLWEGLPIAPIEALYCGLPVVASKIRGTDEVVIDGVNGRLIERFEPKLYADAIRTLLGDEAMRDRLAVQGEAWIKRQYLRPAGSERLARLYEGLLAQGE